MALIGISLIVASVVLFCLRPSSWLPNFFANLLQRRIDPPPPRPPIQQSKPDDDKSSADGSGHRKPSENKAPTSSTAPPEIIIQDAQVEIQVTDTDVVKDTDAQNDTVELQLENDIFQAEVSRREKQTETNSTRADRKLDLEISQQATVVQDEEADEEEEEQSTPKATATLQDDPVPSLVLPDNSAPADADDSYIATEKPSPPSFNMPPPPAFNFEPPPASPEPVLEQREDEAPQPTPAQQLAAPAQTSPLPPTVSTPQLNLEGPATPTKGTSDLMPPPPLPKSKVKPRTSGIPLPASSPARRIPTLAVNSSTPSPPATRIPTPPTNRIPTLNGRIPSLTNPRSASPTTARTSPTAARASPTLPTNGRIPTLANPRSVSPTAARASPTPPTRTALPIPNRRPPGAASSSGLMPPPTATSIPKKPSRQVSLQPGHSPLDWARLAQSPTSDLRGLPPHTPYLRVTPSMLKQQNGRKGRDAWTVFGGKVYNVSPYIPFHPGGGPELLRGAGKDGTRLFAEVHPWVNYETMLQSCLIGLLVEEGEASNAMEEMD